LIHNNKGQIFVWKKKKVDPVVVDRTEESTNQ